MLSSFRTVICLAWFPENVGSQDRSRTCKLWHVAHVYQLFFWSNLVFPISPPDYLNLYLNISILFLRAKHFIEIVKTSSIPQAHQTLT